MHGGIDVDKKYFVVSDIHSFCRELKKGLKQAGFDKENPDHVLIVCGDVFDRGHQTLQTYKFLKSLPEDRCILIRGNHESLYFELLEKDYPEEHDFSNGTVLTFCQIAGFEMDTVYDLRTGLIYRFDPNGILDDYLDLWDNVKTKVRNSHVTEWLQSSQWKNYYELGDYIFVHSFIPLYFDNRGKNLREEYFIYYGETEYFSFKPDWRQATDQEWEKASWGQPFVFFDAGFFDAEKENGKILVCGHYRCSEFNEHYLGLEKCHDIYKGTNLIAIDATTALSKKVNVLVIE